MLKLQDLLVSENEMKNQHTCINPYNCEQCKKSAKPTQQSIVHKNMYHYTFQQQEQESD